MLINKTMSFKGVKIFKTCEINPVITKPNKLISKKLKFNFSL